MRIEHRTALLGCAVLVATAGLFAQTGETPQLEVRRLSEHAIVVRVHAPQATNVIALESNAGIVVIDTEVSPTLAAAIRRTIENVLQRSDFVYLINTHSHGDHTYGNQVFSDAVIIGVDGVPASMREAERGRTQTIRQLTAAIPQMRQMFEGLDAGSEQARSLEANLTYYEAVLSGLTDGFHLTPPDLTFSDQMTLRLGDMTLELVYFGLAHSETDILIFCPELRLIATGDLFTSDGELYVDSERQLVLERWLENVDRMLSDSFSGAAIVPGHGELLTEADIRKAEEFVLAKRDEFAGRSSAFFAFRDVFESEGLEAGLVRIDELHAHPDQYFFFHAEFDSYVYRLMLDGDLDRAVPLFEKLAAIFPDVPNAFDSLGEAYLRIGDTENATNAFERCLELDPEHANARTRLSELRQTV